MTNNNPQKHARVVTLLENAYDTDSLRVTLLGGGHRDRRERQHAA